MNFSKTTTWLIILLVIFIIAAGFFAYQWWKTRGELLKQIEQNENLTRQVDEFKKEIEKLKAQKEEISKWKTYRNEEYGFEFDYPLEGWEFEEVGWKELDNICRVNTKKSENKENFCIGIDIDFLSSSCDDFSWEKIFSSLNPESGGCLRRGGYEGKFEKEITSNFGVKGYKGRLTYPYQECYPLNIVVVYFPLKKFEKRPGEPGKGDRLLLEFSYLDCPQYFDFGPEEIEVFNKIISSFRFIEK